MISKPPTIGDQSVAAGHLVSDALGTITDIQLDCSSSILSHTKINCRKTERATTIPPLESSWRGKSKSALTIFVKLIFDLSCLKHVKTGSGQNSQSRIRFVSSNTRLPRSQQVLLRCLGLSGNWFLRLKEVKLICVRSMTSGSRVPAII